MPEPSGKTTEKRDTIPVTLNAAAQEVIKGIRTDTGIPNTEALARILGWFAEMPRKFRLAILTKDEGGRDELLVDWFREHIATKGIKPETLSPADVAGRARLAKRLIDEIHAMHEAAKEAAPKRKN